MCTQAKKGGELPHAKATLAPFSSMRNSDRLTARFLCAVEEALISGPAHLELEARQVYISPVLVRLHELNCTGLFFYLADLEVFSSGQRTHCKVMS